MNLPELHSETLDAAGFEALLRDIETCAELHAVIPRFVEKVAIPEQAGVSLAQARELVAAGAVRGLQLRYVHEGSEWWDTVLIADGRFRVVRIRQESHG